MSNEFPLPALNAPYPDDTVNGQTAVFGVIGDPVSHTFSPQIHRYFAALRGCNMVYTPFHVKESAVETALAGAHALGIRGLNVTVPHKRAVIPCLTYIDPIAEKIGSVNTLVRTEAGYAGYNTDHIGLTRTLSALGLSFQNRPVVVLGAGGSAYAACVAAAEQEAARLVIINRTPERAAVLAAHVKKYYNIGIEVYTSADRPLAGEGAILIQTTTAGFGPQADLSPVADVSFFEGAALAFDIIYTPWETVFLKQAASAGVRTVNGFSMLVYQAAASFKLWDDAFFKADNGHSIEQRDGTDDDLANRPRLEALEQAYVRRSRLYAN